MQKKTFQLILGSASPRRKELLQWTFLPYSIETSDKEEITSFTDPIAVVQDLAKMKAKDVFSKVIASRENPLVIGADTIVVIDDEILGKPCDKNEARIMLQRLSGRKHSVYTGVCFWTKDRHETFYDKTEVEFEDISPEHLEHYIATGESLDKAGAYGIQGAALGFIKCLNGSYSNVVGLPVNLLIRKLKLFVGHEENEKFEEQFE